MKARTQRGQTLVASLIVVAIICILAVVMLKGTFGESKSSRPDGRGTTIPGAVMAKAQDTECKQYLQQVRMSIQVTQTSTDAFPATIEETNLGSTFYECPLGGEKYQYDPSTGKVTCPHPGHEKL
ncbi:MAG TPA: type II secretion system protein [Fimbriimonadaceae bacterium]|nr:type II secretion system protein [Fimbriimonadaceae bacterium]